MKIYNTQDGQLIIDGEGDTLIVKGNGSLDLSGLTNVNINNINIEVDGTPGTDGILPEGEEKAL